MKDIIENPGYEVAVKLAKELKDHCQKFHIPNDAIIAGVAISAEAIYIKGKEIQKDRIRAILGL